MRVYLCLLYYERLTEMKMKVEQAVEVTLTMSGDDFKNMMNGLKSCAYGQMEPSIHKEDADDVYSRLVEISKISGFEW